MREYGPTDDGHHIERKPMSQTPWQTPEAFAMGPQETSLSLDVRPATEIVPESPVPPYTSLFPRWRIKPTEVIPVNEKHRTMHSLADIKDYELSVREHSAGWQEHMLSKYSSQTEGLQCDRVTAFVGSLGLRRVPTIIRPRADQQAIDRDVEKGLRRPRNHDDSLGFYEHALDLAFVLRDQAAEAAFGPGFTEAVFAHELAHGSTMANDFLYPTQCRALIAQPSRTGFIVAALSPHSPPGFRGLFIEEGFAMHIEGRYIAEELNLPYGFTNETEDVIPWGNVHMATRYAKERQDGIRFAWDAYAGMAIDVLIAKDPALEPAMLESRTEPEAYREVVGRLNAIQPGLYANLRDGFQRAESFIDGLRFVEGAV